MKLPAHLAVDTSKQDEVRISLEVSPDLEAFAGHFPDNPILPGVVQIDWAVRLAGQHLGLTERPRDFQVKYHHIIRPNEPLLLTLKLDPVKRQLSFSYVSEERLMSSGLLKFGAPA